MLLLASIALATSSWTMAPNCPSAFSSVSTTIGAISDSTELTLCASRATLVRGSNGSLTLVIGSQTNTAPKCLVYPNGLSLDLTHNLLASGHVGCWSLYPPSQSIAIVNIGRPSKFKLQSALKSFRPETPKIFYSPSRGIEVGTSVAFSSSAKNQIIKTKLLNTLAQIRFKPTKYRWNFSIEGVKVQVSSASKPKYAPAGQGEIKALLTVSYSIEYLFTGLTNWNAVKPDLVLNAEPVFLAVGITNPPERHLGPPRLVNSPCIVGSSAWRC